MALPQLNRSPSSPPGGAEISKLVGEYAPEEPNCSSNLILPAPLRARRGRRGGGNLATPKNQEVAWPKAEAGTSGRTTHAGLEARGGQHGATGNPVLA